MSLHTVRHQGAAGPCSLCRLRGGSSLPRPAPGAPGLLGWWLQPSHLGPRRHPASPRVCQTFRCPSDEDLVLHSQSPWTIQGRHPHVLHLVTSTKMLFPFKVTFIGPGDEDLSVVIWPVTMCVCVCACVRKRHVCVRAPGGACVCTGAVHVCACGCVCACMRMCTCMHVWETGGVWMHVHMCAHVHVCETRSMCVRRHVCACTCVYVHV